MANRAVSNRWLRASIGLGISAAFLAVTVSRVDPTMVARAWANTAVTLIVLAIALSFLEVAVRAARWQILLRPLANPGYLPTLGFLSIGHLANALLPARLGDLARALMAGSRMRTSRASVLGTIAVERVADVGLLGAAATAGVVVGYRSMANTVLVLGAMGIGTAALVGAVFLIVRGKGVAASRVGALLLVHGGRFARGASSLRNPKPVLAIIGLTVCSFAIAVLILQVVGAAVGLTIPTAQAAVLIAAVTLSTAIPAGPASIGTYEFVGMTLMTSMGFRAEPSLLTIALVHAVATVTPAIMGLIAMSIMGIGPISQFGTRAESSTSERS